MKKFESFDIRHDGDISDEIIDDCRMILQDFVDDNVKVVIKSGFVKCQLDYISFNISPPRNLYFIESIEYSKYGDNIDRLISYLDGLGFVLYSHYCNVIRFSNDDSKESRCIIMNRKEIIAGDRLKLLQFVFQKNAKKTFTKF